MSIRADTFQRRSIGASLKKYGGSWAYCVIADIRQSIEAPVMEGTYERWRWATANPNSYDLSWSIDIIYRPTSQRYWMIKVRIQWEHMHTPLECITKPVPQCKKLGDLQLSVTHVHMQILLHMCWYVSSYIKRNGQNWDTESEASHSWISINTLYTRSTAEHAGDPTTKG